MPNWPGHDSPLPHQDHVAPCLFSNTEFQVQVQYQDRVQDWPDLSLNLKTKFNNIKLGVFECFQMALMKQKRMNAAELSCSDQYNKDDNFKTKTKNGIFLASILTHSPRRKFSKS